ncbi:MAG TPA: tRNA (guanosine(46)-N7)-methyltransferase TrmB [Puia sp.]|jgi:tRNA (guanine-N7-)-methyltransferase|nr:tRNA (guanosine(46)-N7)-methyltransferase TrmB [Puia sp.]
MAQKKLKRFNAIKGFSNVLEYPEGMPGKWHDFFGNRNPIVLELACGKGEYAVGLAKMHPSVNCIGVDLKGNRIYIGARKCLEERIENAAFLRTQIDMISAYFAKAEVQEIWLTFPDPQLRKSRIKKRLTHPKFLRLYQQILVPGGLIHLKTDSPVLYDFTRLVIDMYGLILHRHSDNAYADLPDKEELQIRTHYEALDIARSKRVHYLCFSLPDSDLPQIDPALKQRIKQNEQSIG